MNFKRFQISNVQVPDDVVFLYGSRSVRSKVIQNLLQKFKLSKGQVYTRTSDDKSYYKSFLPSAYISSNINKDGIAYLFKKQVERSSPAFLILDNCFDNAENMDFILQVCKKAKKYQVLVIISCNRGEDFPIELTELSSCIMLSENDNKYDRLELFTAFGEIFETDRVFYKCFDYLTEDDNLMVICKKSPPVPDLQSQVYWYPMEGTQKKESMSSVTSSENKASVSNSQQSELDIPSTLGEFETTTDSKENNDHSDSEYEERRLRTDYDDEPTTTTKSEYRSSEKTESRDRNESQQHRNESQQHRNESQSEPTREMTAQEAADYENRDGCVLM